MKICMHCREPLEPDPSQPQARCCPKCRKKSYLRRGMNWSLEARVPWESLTIGEINEHFNYSVSDTPCQPIMESMYRSHKREGAD
jgi:hypothetical protein